MTWGVFAWQCGYCSHLLSGHLLDDGGDLRSGPYRCTSENCTCDVRQDGPARALTRAEFDALFSAA